MTPSYKSKADQMVRDLGVFVAFKTADENLDSAEPDSDEEYKWHCIAEYLRSLF